MQTISTSLEEGPKRADNALVRTFQASLDALAAQVARVLVVATEAMAHLEGLEETLSILHELCAREAFLQDVAVDELFGSLWTLLGGNRGKLRELKHRASALHEVQQFRVMAVAYVAATTQALQHADAQLGDLRDRLVEVGTEDIPIEMHLASIERSLMRLKAERLYVDGGVTVIRGEL